MYIYIYVYIYDILWYHIWYSVHKCIDIVVYSLTWCIIRYNIIDMNRWSILSKISRKIWRELTWSQEDCSRKFWEVLRLWLAYCCPFAWVSRVTVILWCSQGLRLHVLLQLTLFLSSFPLFFSSFLRGSRCRFSLSTLRLRLEGAVKGTARNLDSTVHSGATLE